MLEINWFIKSISPFGKSLGIYRMAFVNGATVRDNTVDYREGVRKFSVMRGNKIVGFDDLNSAISFAASGKPIS